VLVSKVCWYLVRYCTNDTNNLICNTTSVCMCERACVRAYARACVCVCGGEGGGGGLGIFHHQQWRNHNSSEQLAVEYVRWNWWVTGAASSALVGSCSENE